MKIEINEFLERAGQIIDVRSPQEFVHAHIPGAINVPLFTDDERARVGTTYKKVGQKEAIRLGVELVSPKLLSIFTQIENTCGLKKVYCWRGGMRSGFLCAFLQSLGISCVQLSGGYKAFRRMMLETLDRPLQLQVLGGMTGSGKTEALLKLSEKGHSVLDLEALASHRGSAFGALPDTCQPSNEQFENLLGYALLNKKEPIWIEDESRLIGSCLIPNALYKNMQQAKLFVLDCPIDERVDRIYRLYGSFSKQWWSENVLKVQRRLGGEETKKVLTAIEQDRLPDAIRILLTYYDRAYQYALKRHQGPVVHVTKGELYESAC